MKFLRLQFTDILGVIKNVEVPDRQFAEALDGAVLFDGSSIEGFVRIEESDMYLKPDLDTFQVLPWRDASGARVGGITCDIANPDGTPFEGCPRSALKRAIARAKAMDFRMVAGPEAEFFLFQRRDGAAVHRPPTTPPATSTWRRSIRARTCAARSCWRSSRWASWSRPRITRWRRASTKSTSATTTCCAPPTTSARSASW